MCASCGTSAAVDLVPNGIPLIPPEQPEQHDGGSGDGGSGDGGSGDGSSGDGGRVAKGWVKGWVGDLLKKMELIPRAPSPTQPGRLMHQVSPPAAPAPSAPAPSAPAPAASSLPLHPALQGGLPEEPLTEAERIVLYMRELVGAPAGTPLQLHHRLLLLALVILFAAMAFALLHHLIRAFSSARSQREAIPCRPGWQKITVPFTGGGLYLCWR